MLRAGLASKVASIGMLLSACSAPQEEVKVAPQPDHEAAKQTILRDTIQTMERARAVEDTVAEHQRQLEQAEQQAEGR